ncbi:MAG: hypothetical protein ABJJ82_18000, partial [Marinobacter sp.]
LVVSAFWVLGLPLLSTLPLSGQASSGTVSSLLDAMVKLSSRPGIRASGSTTRNVGVHGKGGKKEIDNDF